MSTPYNARQVEDLDPADADDSGSPATVPPAVRPQFSRRGSIRFDADPSGENTAGTLRPQLSRRNSTNMSSEPYKRGRVVTFRDSFDDEVDVGEKPGEGRALSAREAVAAQEAAEAAAQEAEAVAEQAPVMMSLMDLLEETDREMGLEGSRYILSDDEDFDEDEDEKDEDDGGGEGSMEHTCCICMVRHKAAAFIPCGHTFCRMCSRELMVSRGNCPLCNNFILEILDIF